MKHRDKVAGGGGFETQAFFFFIWPVPCRGDKAAHMTRAPPHPTLPTNAAHEQTKNVKVARRKPILPTSQIWNEAHPTLNFRL